MAGNQTWVPPAVQLHSVADCRVHNNWYHWRYRYCWYRTWSQYHIWSLHPLLFEEMVAQYLSPVGICISGIHQNGSYLERKYCSQFQLSYTHTMISSCVHPQSSPVGRADSMAGCLKNQGKIPENMHELFCRINTGVSPVWSTMTWLSAVVNVCVGNWRSDEIVCSWCRVAELQNQFWNSNIICFITEWWNYKITACSEFRIKALQQQENNHYCSGEFFLNLQNRSFLYSATQTD